MRNLDAMSTTAPNQGVPSPAISRWPNTHDLYRRFDELVKQPMRPIRPANMTRVMNYFDERCQGSKRLAEQAKAVIPGGVQHNLAFNHPFALAITQAQGAHLKDIDGNSYIDFLQAGGPTLLGSNHPAVRNKVNQVLDECGPVTGLLHEYEVKLAELVCQSMPGVEMVRLLGSGTEAVMGAVRLARAYTHRKWIIKIGGAYHGWSDQLVYGMRLPGTGRMEAVGIPTGATAHTQECNPNDLDALRRKLQINRLRGGTAAVVLEPLGPESGTRPVHLDYNRQVRTLCDEFGALLIFDEVVTGFRVGMGGAQAYFDVMPDLTVLGKCLTGGYPMAGAIGGRKDVMMLLVGGIGTTARRAFVGGTLSANPLSCVAGSPAGRCCRCRRPCRGPDLRGAQWDHQASRPALCGLQLRIHCSFADLRGAAAGHQQYLEAFPGQERGETAQTYDGRDGRRVHGARSHHLGRQPHLYQLGRYRRSD